MDPPLKNKGCERSLGLCMASALIGGNGGFLFPFILSKNVTQDDFTYTSVRTACNKGITSGEMQPIPYHISSMRRSS